MTRSRGAVGALLFGLVLLLLLEHLRRAPRPAGRVDWPARVTDFGIPAAIAIGLCLAAYAWHAEVLVEFERGNWDKLDVIARTARFAAEHPWLGVGRGAFSATFAAFYNTQSRFEYAENFVVQWVADWGAPIALMLLVACGHAFLRALRSARSVDRLAGLSGIAAIALQNLVEIGFELVGLAVVVACLFGATVADRSDEAQRGPRSAWQRAAFGVPVAFAIALALLWSPIHRDHRHSLELQLRARFEAGDRAGFRAILKRALLSHPSEPVFAVLGATDALRASDPDAGRFINRSLQLVPGWPASHLLAANWLFRAGHRRQGLLELSIAVSKGAWASRDLMCPIAAADLKGVANLRPAGLDRQHFLGVLARCFFSDPPNAAARDAIILAEYPRDAAALMRDGECKLAAGLPAAALEAAKAASPAGQAARLLEGRALVALDRRQEALAAFRKAEELPGKETDVALVEQAHLLARMGERTRVHDLIGRLRGRAEGSSGVAQAFLLEAALERQMGQPGAALAAYEAAFGITGDSSALRAIAETAHELGDRRRAGWAYSELCGLNPKDELACSRTHELLRKAQ
jgi:hypothetical protein